GFAVSGAEGALFDADLHLVGAVPTLLDQVVGNPLVDRVRPEQVIRGNRRAATQAARHREKSVERIRHGTAVVGRICDGNRLRVPGFVIQVLAEVDMVLVITRIRNLGHDVMPELLLDSKAVLVSPRDAESAGIVADTVSKTGLNALRVAG